MFQLRVCIDVDDLDRGIAFYTRAFDLKVGRREGGDWAELRGGSSSIDLLAKRAGSAPFAGAEVKRDYRRHWTPVHVDVVVTDLEAAVRRAREAGAAVEQDIAPFGWGRLAVLSDPFGNGFCLVEE